MTPGIGDALIGTIIAIVVSIAIIYPLASNKSLGRSAARSLTMSKADDRVRRSDRVGIGAKLMLPRG
jgi:hypothetical protein